MEENNNINDLIQIIKNHSFQRVMVDGKDDWHLFYEKNLYNPEALLKEYNITDGVTIDMLPGNRARDLVPRWNAYRAQNLADLREAKRLSIISEHRRRRRARALFKRIERQVGDTPTEPSRFHH
jgi:hypothetical protein